MLFKISTMQGTPLLRSEEKISNNYLQPHNFSKRWHRYCAVFRLSVNFIPNIT